MEKKKKIISVSIVFAALVVIVATVFAGTEFQKAEAFPNKNSVPTIQNKSGMNQTGAGQYQNTAVASKFFPDGWYSAYEPFGLIYDNQSDTFTFDGKSVRVVFDLRDANGAETDGKSVPIGVYVSVIHYLADRYGEIDVYIVRDYSQKGPDGLGKIIGIEVYSQEEFNSKTYELKIIDSMLARIAS